MKLVFYAVLWVIKSFISDPVVLCLLLASMKLWQTNALVYMEGKISDPSHFLTYPNSYRSIHIDHTEIILINQYCLMMKFLDFTIYPVRNWCSLSLRVFWTKLAAKTNLRKDPGLWQSDPHSGLPTTRRCAMVVSKWNNLEQSWQAEWPLKSCGGHLSI